LFPRRWPKKRSPNTFRGGKNDALSFGRGRSTRKPSSRVRKKKRINWRARSSEKEGKAFALDRRDKEGFDRGVQKGPPACAIEGTGSRKKARQIKKKGESPGDADKVLPFRRPTRGPGAALLWILRSDQRKRGKKRNSREESLSLGATVKKGGKGGHFL